MCVCVRACVSACAIEPDRSTRYRADDYRRALHCNLGAVPSKIVRLQTLRERLPLPDLTAEGSWCFERLGVISFWQP